MYDEPVQFWDGLPLQNRYFKQPEACLPDKANLSK